MFVSCLCVSASGYARFKTELRSARRVLDAQDLKPRLHLTEEDIATLASDGPPSRRTPTNGEIIRRNQSLSVLARLQLLLCLPPIHALANSINPYPRPIILLLKFTVKKKKISRGAGGGGIPQRGRV